MTAKGATMKKLGIRHGEVMLHPVSTVPKGKTENVKSYIVGHSETGHHHVLESVEEFAVTLADTDKMFIELVAPAKLNHQKTVNRHKDLIVPAGIYEVIGKTEYNPFTGLQEAVWD